MRFLDLRAIAGVADEAVHSAQTPGPSLGLTSTTYRGPLDDRISSSESPQHRPFLPLNSGLRLARGMLRWWFHFHPASDADSHRCQSHLCTRRRDVQLRAECDSGRLYAWRDDLLHDGWIDSDDGLQSLCRGDICRVYDNH
jgi:hypothetical protein